MNNMQIFKNEQFGEVRTINKDGEAYFVGKDVAVILGYVNPNEAIHDHVDEEDKLNSKSLSSFTLDLGQRGGWLINESGLYSLILIGELAKILRQNGIEIGQNRLFGWLRDNGYLIKRRGTDYNMPTQTAMEKGLFEIKETVISHSDGHTSINKTTKVTGKGQQYFINHLIYS